MATWASLGSNDVTKEAQAAKDKLASKDAAISAQESKLLKQAEDLEEIKERLHDTLHKLTTASKRALTLESDLEARTEQLQNEKLSAQNAQIALNAANETIRSRDLETRELQSILDSLSHKNTDDISKLQQAKLAAEKKVRQLEASIQDMKNTPAPAASRLPTRARSSSVSNGKISNLEQDMLELRSQLSRAQQDLSQANQKISHSNSQLMQTTNEKTAAERKYTIRIAELESRLEDQEDELEMLRNNQGNGEREAELMERIEADEAQIEALQTMLRSGDDAKALKQQLKTVEDQLQKHQDELANYEADNVDLVADKEAALDQLDAAKAEIQRLENQLREVKDARDNDSGNGAEVVALNTQLERMVPIAERYRSERDEARSERDEAQRHLEFMEAEQRFTIEALEKVKTNLNQTADKSATLVQTDSQAQALTTKANLVINALTIVIRHSASQSEFAFNALYSAAESAHSQYTADHQGQSDRIAVLEERLDVTSQGLAALAQERDDLHRRLSIEESTVITLQSSIRNKDAEIEQLNHLLDENSKEMINWETERNSLQLQITNLNADLEAAQEELVDAERQYSALQSQQLNSMSSNQAVSSLKQHIQELEGRIERRMETIGILQHDKKRMETNLSLHEDRIAELTAELEQADSEKRAMVEDCEENRNRRDEEHAKVEILEEQMEVLEAALESRDRETQGTISSYLSFVSKSQIHRKAAQAERVLMVERINTLQASLQDVQQQLGDYTTEVTSLRGQAAASQSSQDVEREHHDRSAQSIVELQGRLDSETSHLRSNLEEKTREYASLQAQYDELEDEFTMSRQQTSDLSQTIDHLLRSVDEEKNTARLVQEKVDLLEAKLKAAEAERATLHSKHASDTAESQEEHRKAVAEWQTRCDELDGKLAAALEDKTIAEAKIGDLEKQLAEARASESEDSNQAVAIQKQLEETKQELESTKASQAEVQAQLNEARANLVSADESKDKADAELAQASTEQQKLNEEIANLNAQIEEEKDLHRSNVARVSELEDTVESLKTQHAQEKTVLEEKVEKLSQNSSTEMSALQTQIAGLTESMESVRGQLQEAEEERDQQQMQVTSLSADVHKLTSLKRHNEAQLHDTEKKVAAINATLDKTKEKLAESNKKAETSSADLTMQVIRHQQEIEGLRKDLAVWEAKPRLDIMLSELEEKNNELEELLRTKSEEIDESDEKILEILQEKKKALAKVDSLTRKVQLLQTKLAAMKATEAPTQPPLPKASSSRGIEQKVSSESIAPSSRPVAHPRTSSSRSIEQKPSQESIAFPPSRPSSAAASTSGSMAASHRESARRSTAAPRPPPENIPIPAYIPAPPKHRSSSPHRAVSGSSSLPRSKTPERKSAPTVFRAKTPDLSVAGGPASQMETTSLAGKKRRTPDEHEPEERQPAQLFTTESTPAGTPNPDFSAGITPRTRTLSNTPHAGFTPRRRPVAVVNDRPAITAPSPKAPRVQPPSREPENNPTLASQPERPAKKTWLGKIRGGASARP